MTTDKATDVIVTQADEKRADDWAMMLGRMGGVILDQSQRRGLAAQFAAHRIASEQPASGERWATIDSAPKDGSEIIAICASAYSPTAHETWWQGGWTLYSRPDEKWHGGVGKWFPTHWMPKPALSTTSEAPAQEDQQ